MAVHYILDGYNIVKQIPHLNKTKLEAARQSLVRFIEIERPQGSVRNMVTIVFDGKTGYASPENGAHVKIIFSTNDSADECIQRLVAGHTNKKNIYVVTDDRQLRYAVRSMGAQIVHVREFLQRKKTHHDTAYQKRQQAHHVRDSKQIPRSLEHSINQEFENLWLCK